MNDLEELVTATLHEHALEAPVGDNLAGATRVLHRRRQRARLGMLATAAAFAVASGIAVPMVVSSSLSGPRPMHPVGHHPFERMQRIAFHGIEFDVPASWAINATRCGTPIRDTVVRDQGGVPLCGIRRPVDVQSVEVGDQPQRWLMQPRSDIKRHLNFGGTVVLEARIGAHDLAVTIPGAGVGMDVIVSTRSLESKIVRSIRVVGTDDNGCVMRHPQLNPSTTPSNGDVATLVPPTTRSIAFCKYTEDWLTASTTLTGAAVTRFARVVDHLPPGLGHAPPNSYLGTVCTDHTSSDWRSGFVLLLTGADGRRTTLWAHAGTCGALGITDGTAAGRLTARLVLALVRPLHTGADFPGHVLPGP
jgi:hypothetical protein